jgi:hypothetical protein
MFEDEEDLEDIETQSGAEHHRPPSPPPTRSRKTIGHKPYTPQFSALATVSVRRLAWALGLTMPKAVDQMVRLLPSLFPLDTVCAACKDNTKCQACAFHQQPAADPAAPAA